MTYIYIKEQEKLSTIKLKKKKKKTGKRKQNSAQVAIQSYI